MILERITDLKAPDGHDIPALLLTPEAPRGGVVIIPFYAGSKEQMMGLAVAAAERRFAALALDICGHGENLAPIGPGMRDEVEAAIAYMRGFGHTTAIGLSLGGRLALMSSADAMVAISPSVITQMSPQGKWMFENLPSPGVREPYSGYVLELLEKLGPVTPHNRRCLLLYSERDIPAIMEGATGLKAQLPGAEVRHIHNDVRPDIQHDVGLIRYLPRWFNHLELKFNPEAVRLTADWVAQQQASAHSA